MATVSEQIREALQSIIGELGDEFTVEQVLKEVRRLPKKHPIHREYMNWDQKAAAEEYFLTVTRRLITTHVTLTVTRFDREFEGPEIIRDPMREEHLPGFRRIASMNREAALRAVDVEIMRIERDVAGSRLRMSSFGMHPDIIQIFADRLDKLIGDVLSQIDADIAVEARPRRSSRRGGSAQPSTEV